eukprot:765974-Hanusia_phi.AAC.2
MEHLANTTHPFHFWLLVVSSIRGVAHRLSSERLDGRVQAWSGATSGVSVTWEKRGSTASLCDDSKIFFSHKSGKGPGC